MAVPDYQSFMRPLLSAVQDGTPHPMKEICARLVQEFQLSQSDLSEMLPSGRQATYLNRIGWAKTYLLKAGTLESPQRGVIRITDRGRVLLKQPKSISTKMPMEFPEFVQFQGATVVDASQDPLQPKSVNLSPEEQLDALYMELNSSLASDLSQQTPGQPQSRDRPFIFLANERFQYYSVQVGADEWCRYAAASVL